MDTFSKSNFFFLITKVIHVPFVEKTENVGKQKEQKILQIIFYSYAYIYIYF